MFLKIQLAGHPGWTFPCFFETLFNNVFPSKDILLNGSVPGEVIYDDVLYLQSKLYLKQEKYIEAISSLEKIIAADNQGFLTDDVYFMMAEIYNYNLKCKSYLI